MVDDTSDEFEEVHQELIRKFDSPKAFKKTFGARSPDTKTVARLFEPDPTKREPVYPSTLERVKDCLWLENRFYFAYRSLLESLGLEDDGQEQCADLVGDYVYYRANLEGGVASGGMRFFCQRGVYRFWHFNDAKAFRKFREKDRAAFMDGSEVSDDEIEQRLLDHRSKDKSQYNHKGFFFVQGDRLTMVGMDDTYFRAILGSVDASRNRAVDPLKVLVLGRSAGGGVFAAKSLIFHSSHKSFRKAPSDLMDQLGVVGMTGAILQFS